MAGLRTHKATFEAVLYNGENQVLVRELVNQLMPADIKAEMVRRYNQNIDQINAIILRELVEEAGYRSDSIIVNFADGESLKEPQ